MENWCTQKWKNDKSKRFRKTKKHKIAGSRYNEQEQIFISFGMCLAAILVFASISVASATNYMPQDCYSFTIESPLYSPVSDPAGPYTGTEGVPLVFTGSGSYDPDGTIAAYEWDFGDGDRGTGVAPTHTYAQDGTYTVALTVTDNDDETNRSTTTATIADTEPTVDFSATPTSGQEALTVSFTDNSTSYDGILEWNWDFDNDGETDSTVQNPTHVYAEDGVYTVSLKVTESDGDSDTITKADYITVTKVNNAPSAPDNPSPSDGATDVSIAEALSWTGGDPDAGDTVAYNVYFGTCITPPLVAENQSGSTYGPGTLNRSTLYYWQIVATDNHGAYNESEVWSFTTTVSLPDLAADWHLDEGTGIIAEDTSGNSNDGTLMNNPTWVNGKEGKALSFDGTDDYVDCGQKSSLKITGAITVEAWVNWQGDGNPYIVTKTGDSGHRSYDLSGNSDGTVEFRVGGTDCHSIKSSGTAPIPTGEWVYLVGTYEPSSYVRLFVNGALAAEDTTSIPAAQGDNGLPWYIGAREGNQGWFDGIVDEVKIHNGALSAEEIRENYKANPSNQPPIAAIDSITPETAEQERDSVSFSGHGTDTDGLVVAYNWRSSVEGQLSTTSSFGKSASELSVGTHTIYFKVQDDKGAWSTEVTDELTINQEQENRLPFADPSGPYTGTEGIPRDYDGSGSYDSDGSIVAYVWDFGDGDTATGVAPTHTYAQNGTYTVALTVTDNDRATNTSTTTAAIADTEPTADFSASPTSGQEPLTVTFTDNTTSHDGLVAWSWDFDNDGVADSTEHNPTYEYAEDGVYTVNLKVRESDGDSETKTKVEYITVIRVNAPPVSNPAGPYTGTEGVAIAYDGSGSYDPDGSIVAYGWDFGDETTATGVAPTHTYAQDGTYTVALTVTDNDDATNTSTTTATIADTEPTAAFSASPTSGQEPLTVTFTDNSTSHDGLVAWDWDFDNDGEIDSTEHNPTQVYAEDGVYTVCLTVTESDGDTDTMTKMDYITVIKVNAPPVSNPAGPYTGTEGVAIVYDGSGSYDPDGSIVAYEWDFGDGNTATSVAPTHTYAQNGTYTVALTVTDNDDATNTSTTTATIADTKPTADFSASPTRGQEPLTVTFTDNSASYDGITAWEWDFDNDCVTDSTEQNPTQVYAEDGKYTVSLIVTESDGDRDTMTKADYITVTRVNNAPYVADNPSPSDGATEASIDEVLSWTGGDPDDGDVVTYNVYFGTSITPPLVAESQPETTYDPGIKAHSTEYYWQIIATDNHGASRESEVWSFVTDSAPSPDLVAEWDLDAGSGETAVDSSGNSNDGTLVNNPTWVDGKVGKGLSFDGTNDYVDCGQDTSLKITGAITVEAWVNWQGDGNPYIVTKMGGPSHRSYDLSGNSDGTVEFRVGGSNCNTIKSSGSTPIPTGEWVYLVGTYEPSSYVRLFVNGALAVEETTSIPASQGDNGLAWYIGAREGYEGYFRGIIDEVKIHNGALSAEEIRANYEANPSNQPPIAAIDSITPETAEQGKETVSFTGHGTDTDGSVVAYNWRSSMDGQLSTASSYSKPATELSAGTHTIYFKVQDDKGAWSTEVTEELTINQEPENSPPVADLKGPYTGTEGIAIAYDGSGSYDDDGNIVAYDWDFGDGDTATGVTPTHTYAHNGTYTVTLTVTDNDGATNTNTTTATIADTEPTADFSASPTSGPEPLTVAFTDVSDSYDGIEAREWDFDNDGAIDSTEQNPTYEYAEDGVYTVCLTVTESDGDTDTLTKTDYITVIKVNAPPVSNPSGPYTGTEGIPMVCDGSNSYDPDGSIVAYEWDFGDGNTATGVAPTHTYAQEGTYTVALTVTDNDDAANTSTTTATIADTEPTADFSAAPTSGLEPLTVTFTDNSASYDGIETWNWDFDNDGEIDSTEQNPTHVYAEEGVYTVSLTITESDEDSDTMTKEEYITVTKVNEPPVADPSGPYTGTEEVPIVFTGSVSYDPDGTIAAYEWDFGDETTATGVAPTHTYAQEGTYTIALTVTDNDDETSTSTTTATIADTEPTADFTATPTSKQEPVTVTFTDNSASYDGLEEWAWDFDNDGETDSTEQNPTHEYIEEGVYTVSLTVTESDEDSDTMTKEGYITVTKVNEPPVADPSGPYTGTEGAEIDYDGSNSYDHDPEGSIVAYEWDFGDGDTATDVAPTHTYAQNGAYTVTLTVTDDEGATVMDTTTTTIADTEPTADFSAARTHGPEPLTVAFTDNSASYDGIETWAWDFDNDGVADSTEQNPAYVYLEYGRYTVSLTVTESDGDSGTMTKADHITVIIGKESHRHKPAGVSPSGGATDVPVDED